jgi:hypothetical protein
MTDKDFEDLTNTDDYNDTYDSLKQKFFFIEKFQQKFIETQ